ncbi:MAG: hypothetical protein U0U09_16240 [Cyclobacteriaceae bacterium]
MKIKFTPVSLLVSLLIVTALSCDETTIVKNYTGTGEEKTYSIEGYAQKGPFIVGSNVTVSELNENLYPTGRVFFATILDNTGHFELPGVILVSPFILIKVEGSSYSEVQGGVPTGESLTLYSIADITESETININILTHLEKERVEYLVQEESKSFNEAKEQALEELLEVFDLQDYSVQASEDLTILSSNEGNAVLLAVSSIIEGVYNYERKLALITNFQRDFEDGVLDATDIQNTLITSAFSLNTQRVVDNLTDKFPSASIPDFKPVVDHFLNTSEYVNYFSELFVRNDDGSINLLNNENINSLDPADDYILYLNPPQGVNVVINITFEPMYYSDEANFNASAAAWTNSEISISCPPEPDPHCNVRRTYTISANGNDLQPIEIPITSFTGHGTIGLSFDLTIDELFSTSKISFAKTLTW